RLIRDHHNKAELAKLGKGVGARPGNLSVIRTLLTMIYRRFLDISGRQIHYRESDNLAGGVPLVMLHLLPGSSLQLGPLMQDLSPRYALAPDIAGAGDSDPLDLDQPSIADLAADVLALIEARCGNKPVDLYGTHTGACVAIELAASHPDLVRSVIIDGVPIFDASTAAKFAEP